MSRLKTMNCPARFVAVSATFPNVEDVSRWLGGDAALHFNFTEEYRPVQLNRVVIGRHLHEEQEEIRKRNDK